MKVYAKRYKANTLGNADRYAKPRLIGDGKCFDTQERRFFGVEVANFNGQCTIKKFCTVWFDHHHLMFWKEIL